MRSIESIVDIYDNTMLFYVKAKPTMQTMFNFMENQAEYWSLREWLMKNIYSIRLITRPLTCIAGEDLDNPKITIYINPE